MDGVSIGNAIRKMAMGIIISEYGLLEIKDQVSYDLKQKVNRAIRSSNDVQDYFRKRQDAAPEVRELFTRLFNSNEQYLLAEILAALWDHNEDDLEMVLESINKNKEERDAAAAVAADGENETGQDDIGADQE